MYPVRHELLQFVLGWHQWKFCRPRVDERPELAQRGQHRHWQREAAQLLAELVAGALDSDVLRVAVRRHHRLSRTGRRPGLRQLVVAGRLVVARRLIQDKGRGAQISGAAL